MRGLVALVTLVVGVACSGSSAQDGALDCGNCFSLCVDLDLEVERIGIFVGTVVAIAGGTRIRLDRHVAGAEGGFDQGIGDVVEHWQVGLAVGSRVVLFLQHSHDDDRTHVWSNAYGLDEDENLLCPHAARERLPGQAGVVLTMPLAEYLELVRDGATCRARLDRIGLRDHCEDSDLARVAPGGPPDREVASGLASAAAR
jgi:hypothetical protein